MFFNIDNAKSYKTEKNLERGLEKIGLSQFKYLVVCNREGRFTAIFSTTFNTKALFLHAASAAQHGFKTF